MKIAKGIEMLEISSNVMGGPSVIYPTLIRDKDQVILVDTGFPGQLSLIREAMEKVGVPLEKLNKIILTHHDIDHMGSAGSISKELSHSVKILAHEDEKPYIQGDKPAIKVTKLEDNINSLSENMKDVYSKLKYAYENCKIDVDGTLADGEKLPYCGGIDIIYTPGHTLGHICLYLESSKTLIAGDILAVQEGKLVKASDVVTFDIEENKKSIKKLTKYDVETVICYHGGLYKDNVNQCIEALAWA